MRDATIAFAWLPCKGFVIQQWNKRGLLTPYAVKASAKEETEINYLGEIQRERKWHTHTHQQTARIIPLTQALSPLRDCGVGEENDN